MKPIKHKRLKVCVFVIACALTFYFFALQHEAKELEKYRENSQSVIDDINHLQTGSNAYEALLTEINSDSKNDKGFADFQRDDIATYTVHVPEEGYYHLLVSLYPNEEFLSNIDIAVAINGEYQFEESENIRVYTEWSDDGQILIDRYGNEVVPSQKIINKNYQVKLIDQNANTAYPFTFYFKQGENEIQIKNNRTAFYIAEAITLAPIQPIIQYEEYRDLHSAEPVVDYFQMYEAENMMSKNKASILPEAERDPSMTPYDSSHLKLNFAGGDNYFTAGETIKWEISAPKSGLYQITFKTKQIFKEFIAMPVFRTLKLDGEIPFAELASYCFNYSNRWENHTLGDSDGNPYLIYLTEGSHELSMTIDNSPFTETLTILNNMVEEINLFTLDVRKMTGNIVDKNREWDLSEYMPDAGSKINGWVKTLEERYDYLLSISDSKASYVTFMKIALQMMKNIAKDPNDIPNQLSALSTGGSSVFAQLSTIMSYIEAQPLPMDAFYIHGDGAELPKTEVSFWTKAWEATKRFFRTFTAQEYAVSGHEGEEITVWVGKSRSYVTLLQQIIDTEFTPKTGIRVQLSIMPDEKKMILGNASGTNPDMAIGASTNYPYELAIRGAAAELSSKDGFFTSAQHFQPGAFISYMMDGGVYAMPETQDFWVTFYRKDILDALGLDVPETWDDVVNMLPTLQRYGMNFASNISFFESTKPLQATIPFIYQFGGDIVSADGMTTAIDQESSLVGIKFMTDLFNIYSTPERIANLYISMQRGEIPIGIGNFSTYITLSFAASDMTGKWDIAPLPGVLNDDGTVDRQAPGSAQCSIIFENSTKKEQAWELLKWYSSPEVQMMYSDRLFMTYGEGYVLNTANIPAFEHVQMPDSHKAVVKEQWESLVELPRIPGYYMIERELSNAWNKVVIDGATVRESVDDSAILINREIRRRMEDFRYIEDGQLVREYDVPTLEKVTAWLKDGLRKELGE